MGQRRDTQSTDARARRLEELRAAVTTGSYRPEPTLVAESVLAWLAPVEVFETDLRRGIPPVEG